MTDKIKVLPTITKKQMGTSADVIKLLEQFKDQIKDRTDVSKCIVIGFGGDGINPLISYGFTKDLPLFETIGVLEYMKQELIVGGEE